jgi:hypothetical protein
MLVCVLTQDSPTRIDRPRGRNQAVVSSELGAPSPENTLRSSAPSTNTLRAALLTRERLLVEEIRSIGEAWNRHRVEIESELGDVRRRLGRLASPTMRKGARAPHRARSEFRKDAPAKGAPTPPVSRVPQPEIRKKQETSPRSLRGRLYDRMLAVCVVETTAAAQSGMSSWKTAPCRVLLRLLAKPVVSAISGS